MCLSFLLSEVRTYAMVLVKKEREREREREGESVERWCERREVQSERKTWSAIAGEKR